MSKSIERIRSTGEIFTTPELVNIMVHDLYVNDSTLFTDLTKRMVDTTCGDGEFLRGTLRKFEQERDEFTTADRQHAITNQLFGVDLMYDNVCDTIYYLLFGEIGEDTTFEIESEPTEHLDNPIEINAVFNKRSYFHNGDCVLEVRKVEKSNHFVEYRMHQKGQWIRMENIVRANALTEWDFEKWKPVDTFYEF